MPDSVLNTANEPHPDRLKAIRAEAHPYCVVCSQSNPAGLGVQFTVRDNGSVSASFIGHAGLEGYQGCLHGGLIASLLDGAMTNCLFAHGYVALTAELKVRYRKPVLIGVEMTIQARILRSQNPLHLLEAELEQEGCVKVIASAKFCEPDESAGHS